LPSVARGWATTTTAGRAGDSTSTNLVWVTIKHPEFKGDISRIEIAEVIHDSGQRIHSLVDEKRIPDTVDALSRARRPLGPIRQLAVDLNTLELVSALNALARAFGADTRLEVCSLNKGNTKNQVKVWRRAKIATALIEVVPVRESNVIDLEIKQRLSSKFGIETTVVRSSSRAAVTGLDRNVAENA
jgi:hypothetical protein